MAGWWVWPQQLEDALLQCGAVKLAAAVPVLTPDGLTRLRAFVVLAPEMAEREAEWTAAARARLEKC